MEHIAHRPGFLKARCEFINRKYSEYKGNAIPPRRMPNGLDREYLKCRYLALAWRFINTARKNEKNEENECLGHIRIPSVPLWII
jgi:hypothetical protein